MPRGKFEGAAAKSLRETAPVKKARKPVEALERAASVRPGSFTEQEEDWFAAGEEKSKANVREAAKMVMPRSRKEQYEAALEKQAESFRYDLLDRLNRNLLASPAGPSTVGELLRGADKSIMNSLHPLAPSVEEAKVAMGQDKQKAYEAMTSIWSRMLDGLFAYEGKQERLNIEDAMSYVEKLMAAAKTGMEREKE